VYDTKSVKGSEFLRKARRVARSKKLTCTWVPAHGKGSHGTLYVGANGRTPFRTWSGRFPREPYALWSSSWNSRRMISACA